VIQNGKQVQFYALDKLIAQGPPDDTQLKSFTLELAGYEEEAWHITVDSVRVTA
jgi:hypothetical protein